MIEREAISRSPSLLRLLADADRDPDRVVAVAEQQEVAIGERDLPARGRIDRDPLAFALDRRAVRGAQVAKHVVVADLRDHARGRPRGGNRLSTIVLAGDDRSSRLRR